MKREGGIIEMTPREVRTVWQSIYGEPIPEDVISTQSAAEACLMTLGAGKIEERLLARQVNEFDPSD